MEQLRAQFVPRRRAKADRVSHAICSRRVVRGDGYTIMRIAWRQVKHVASVQNKLFFRLKILQNFQGYSFLQRQIFLLADSPSSLAARLKQKNVVAVEMWPDATTRRRIGNHDIVQTCIRHKTKLLEQAVNASVMGIDPLHQKSPASLRHRRKCPRRKRA